MTKQLVKWKCATGSGSVFGMYQNLSWWHTTALKSEKWAQMTTLSGNIVKCFYNTLPVILKSVLQNYHKKHDR